MPQRPSQPDHDPVIQEFFNWVRSDSSQGILGPAPEVNCPFMPDPKLETYFRNHRRVRDILRALFPDGDPPVDPGWIERKCAKVFSILLLIGKGNFIAHFIKHESLYDNYLPFKSRPIDFPTATNDPLFFESFYKQQWTFCARVFQYNEIDMRLDNDRILPIIYKEKIAGGGSAVAYKIILHAAYNRLDPRGENARDPSNRFANTFVLKTYHTSDAARYYKNEVGAFRRLMSNRARELNMIGFYGSYVLDGTYNILLEYANKGTLEQYFQSTDPPSTGEDIIAFWRGVFDVVRALVKIHEPPTEDVEGPQIFHGWHQDVKPSNVLVTSEDDETPYNCQFKLADLGLSHFRRKVAAQGGITDRDARGTRAYSTSPHDITPPPPPVVTRITGAPECYRSDDFIETSQLDVKQSVDIWSLGCVYSEAAAWVVLGKRGLRHYRLRRQAETDTISKFRDSDCFHNGEEALKTVHETHEYICRNLRASDHITMSTLAMVKDMLDNSDLRPNAMQLWKKSRRTLNDAQKKLESQAADLLDGGEHQTRLSQKGSHRRPQTPPQDTSRHQDKRGWSININNEPRERPTMHNSAALERIPSLENTMEDDDASLHTTPDPSSSSPFLASSPSTHYSTLPTQKRPSTHDDFRDSQHSETSNDEYPFDRHRIGMSNGEYRVDRRYQPTTQDRKEELGADGPKPHSATTPNVDSAKDVWNEEITIPRSDSPVNGVGPADRVEHVQEQGGHDSNSSETAVENEVAHKSPIDVQNEGTHLRNTGAMAKVAELFDKKGKNKQKQVFTPKIKMDRTDRDSPMEFEWTRTDKDIRQSAHRPFSRLAPKQERTTNDNDSRLIFSRQANDKNWVFAVTLGAFGAIGAAHSLGWLGDSTPLTNPLWSSQWTILTFIFVLILGSYWLLPWRNWPNTRRTYRYTSLDVEKNEIRLLYILPSKHKDDLVNCTLRHVSLSENPAYVALSYNWGDRNEQRLIRLNGVIVSVTASLEEALRHMRPRWRSLELWVDALCIDQSSKKERGAQVLRMFGIYQQARVVTIWLGSEADGSGKVMNVLSRSQGLERPIDYGDRYLRPSFDNDPPTSEEWHCFLTRPYWQRVWIIQEIAAATQICILCGEWTVELRNIGHLLTRLAELELPGLDNSVLLIRRLFELRNSRRNQIPIRLLDTLQQTSQSTSSETLDKVYGLLGLAFDRATFVTEPNYSLSKSQLCQTMTENAILSTGSLDFILLDKENATSLDVPTWCTDYTATDCGKLDSFMVKYLSGQDFRNRMGTQGNRWNTTGDTHVSNLMVSIDRTEGLLHVKGLQIGAVSDVGGIMGDPPLPELRFTGTAKWSTMTMYLFRILFIYNEALLSEGNVVALCHILNSKEPSPILKDPAYQLIQQWFHINHSFDIHGQEMQALVPEIQDQDVSVTSKAELPEIMTSISLIISEGLRIMTMEKPHIGWAHPDAKPNDEIFLFQGCSMPVVLRPVPGLRNRFAIVGRAYVPNAMNNEYADRLRESARWIEIS